MLQVIYINLKLNNLYVVISAIDNVNISEYYQFHIPYYMT